MANQPPMKSMVNFQDSWTIYFRMRSLKIKPRRNTKTSKESFLMSYMGMSKILLQKLLLV